MTYNRLSPLERFDQHMAPYFEGPEAVNNIGSGIDSESVRELGRLHGAAHALP